MTIPNMPDHRPGDVRGFLTFVAPLPNDLQNAEDSTQEADMRLHTGTVRKRQASPTERLLLEHLGFDLTDHPELETHVSYRSHTLRRREWPDLATATPTDPRTNQSTTTRSTT